MKTCKKCGVSKPLTDFHKNPKSRDGRGTQCKKCTHANLAEQRKRPEAKERFKKYAWRSMIKKRYAMTEQRYNVLLDAQRGGCAICGALTAADKFQRRLHIDHCHETKTVRGLLCGNCNNGIGRFKEDANLLRIAAAYLEHYDAYIKRKK